MAANGEDLASRIADGRLGGGLGPLGARARSFPMACLWARGQSLHANPLGMPSPVRRGGLDEHAGNARGLLGLPPGGGGLLGVIERGEEKGWGQHQWLQKTIPRRSHVLGVARRVFAQLTRRAMPPSPAPPPHRLLPCPALPAPPQLPLWFRQALTATAPTPAVPHIRGPPGEPKRCPAPIEVPSLGPLSACRRRVFGEG